MLPCYIVLTILHETEEWVSNQIKITTFENMMLLVYSVTMLGDQTNQ